MAVVESAGFLIDEAQAMKVPQLSSETPAVPLLANAALEKKSLDDDDDDDDEVFLMDNLWVDAARAIKSVDELEPELMSVLL
jgi:hypothetical protein